MRGRSPECAARRGRRLCLCPPRLSAVSGRGGGATLAARSARTPLPARQRRRRVRRAGPRRRRAGPGRASSAGPGRAGLCCAVPRRTAPRRAEGRGGPPCCEAAGGAWLGTSERAPAPGARSGWHRRAEGQRVMKVGLWVRRPRPSRGSGFVNP